MYAWKIAVPVLLAWLWLAGPGVEAAPANLLSNPGFEVVETIQDGVPTSAGDWAYDEAAVVTTSDGITPHSGVRMLKFIYGDWTSPNVFTRSEVFQTVDVSAFAADIDGVGVRADASFWANRVAGDAGTDTLFEVMMAATSGTPATFPADRLTPLATSTSPLLTDGLTATWQQLSTSMILPVGTRTVSIQITAVENVVNDLVAPEFDGHYADDASLTLTVIPEPATLASLGLGALAAVFVRRRRG